MSENREKALDLYGHYDFVEAEDFSGMFFERLAIDGAIKRLKEIKEEFDAELIRRMKEAKLDGVEIDAPTGRVKVYWSKKKKEIITDLKRLQNMLLAGTSDEQALAQRALAGGQSAWKLPQVRVLADTLGLTDLIETTYEDKVEIKILPVEMLEKRKAVSGGNS